MVFWNSFTNFAFDLWLLLPWFWHKILKKYTLKSGGFYCSYFPCRFCRWLCLIRCDWYVVHSSKKYVTVVVVLHWSYIGERSLVIWCEWVRLVWEHYWIVVKFVRYFFFALNFALVFILAATTVDSGGRSIWDLILGTWIQWHGESWVNRRRSSIWLAFSISEIAWEIADSSTV
jgi:hypothetical protein